MKDDLITGMIKYFSINLLPSQGKPTQKRYTGEKLTIPFKRLSIKKDGILRYAQNDNCVMFVLIPSYRPPYSPFLHAGLPSVDLETEVMSSGGLLWRLSAEEHD